MVIQTCFWDNTALFSRNIVFPSRKEWIGWAHVTYPVFSWLCHAFLSIMHLIWKHSQAVSEVRADLIFKHKLDLITFTLGACNVVISFSREFSLLVLRKPPEQWHLLQLLSIKPQIFIEPLLCVEHNTKHVRSWGVRIRIMLSLVPQLGS